MKLNSKARDAVEILLNTYSALCQAEKRVGRRRQDFGITVSSEDDDSDFLSVSINVQIVKVAIAEQKATVKKSLAKYGISVE